MRLRAPLVAAFAVVVAAPALARPERSLQVTLRCEQCTADQRPSLGLLWRADAAGRPETAALQAADWPEGRFTLDMPSGSFEVTGRRTDDGAGWTLDLPLGKQPLPFRVVAALEGFTADRAAWWPEREDGIVITLQPTADVLDQNPAWDPARTPECEVMIPKDAPQPFTFYVDGQPRAWLYRAADAADATPQWTFQFVRPSQTLLERVNVTVAGFDEGASWSFRLPLQSVFAGGAVWSQGAAASSAPAAEARIAGAGVVRLDDCPREAR